MCLRSSLSPLRNPPARGEFPGDARPETERSKWSPSGDARVSCRRKVTLKELGAELLDHTSEERLIIGLGLPHPTETGFLLDRLTGCPYLPGSSVKGLLRAAARDVARGDLDLEDEQTFWKEHLETVFGTSSSDEDSAARGDCAVYDAFPERWPTLEPDVLTPHYSGYYSGEEKYPGDWEDPVPVTFLTLRAGTKFLFPIRPLGRCVAADDLVAHIRPLLALALSWLGAGGKTQAGYGYFEDKLDEAFGRVPGQETWKNVHVKWEPNTGLVSTTHEGKKRRLEALREGRELFAELPDSFVKKFKRDRVVQTDVVVRQAPGRWEILEIKVP